MLVFYWVLSSGAGLEKEFQQLNGEDCQQANEVLTTNPTCRWQLGALGLRWLAEIEVVATAAAINQIVSPSPSGWHRAWNAEVAGWLDPALGNSRSLGPIWGLPQAIVCDSVACQTTTIHRGHVA